MASSFVVKVSVLIGNIVLVTCALLNIISVISAAPLEVKLISSVLLPGSVMPEKDTLRVLLMSNVKPSAYLAGVGIYVFLMCMIGAVIIAFAGGYRGKAIWSFILVMVVGIIVSVMTGAVIGTMSKNQMMATSVMMPVMMIFSFVPMLSMFNETIEKIGKVIYTQQISRMLNSVSELKVTAEQMLVIGITVVCAFGLFLLAYKKCGLE